MRTRLWLAGIVVVLGVVISGEVRAAAPANGGGGVGAGTQAAGQENGEGAPARGRGRGARGRRGRVANGEAATQSSPAEPPAEVEMTPTKVSLLDRFVTDDGVVTESNADGLRVRLEQGRDGKLLMPENVRTPMTITARMETDGKNIELSFGNGLVAFDVDDRSKDLHHHDPKNGRDVGVAGKGDIPANTWATIKWTISETESTVEVDGVQRASFSGDYKGISARPGIEVAGGSPVTVAAFDVATSAPAAASAAAGPFKLIEAKWGADTRWRDVLPVVSALVKDNRLEMVAGSDVLGDPASGAVKQLMITYEENGQRKTQYFDEKGQVSIGDPRPEWKDRIAAGQKSDAKALVVLSAKVGRKDFSRDVTDLCAGLASGDSLTLPVSGDALQISDPESTVLDLTYFDTQEEHLRVNNGQTLQIGRKTTSFVKPGEGAKNVEKTVATLRVKNPQGLLVLDARWGKDRSWQDETALCQGVVSGDSLTVPVAAETFNQADSSWTQLRVVYFDGKNLLRASAKDGETLQVGSQVTSFLRVGKGLENAQQTIAAMRASHPQGLLVLDARVGKDRDWKDVTDLCQGVVWGDSLTVPVQKEAFSGQGGGDWTTLKVTYSDGKSVETASAQDGKTLQIGGAVTSFVRRGSEKDGLISVEKEVAAHKEKAGDGLFLLDAQFGATRDWADVRAKLEAMVSGDRLSVKVGDQGWPDPAPGQDKQVVVLYWDGSKTQSVTVKQNDRVEISGTGGTALAKLSPLPGFAAEGQRFTHAFGVAGNYALKEGPAGAVLSSAGEVSWTPNAKQVGVQEFRFEVTVGGRTYSQKQSCEVVSAAVAASVGGDLAKLQALMELNLTGGGHDYEVNGDMGGALLLEGSKLAVLGADGISVTKRLDLKKPYVRIAERPKYYEAIRVDPVAMDLLDKSTGNVEKTIKLDYRKFHDLALAPGGVTSYVTVEFAPTVPSDRIVIVNEATGEVREPKDLLGSYVKIDRSGKHMWAGLSDIYQNGTDFYVNPGFNIVGMPTYGNIDFLIRYDLTPDGPAIAEHLEEVGANGGQIRISPDGKRVSYLSFTGFPEASKNMAAWDGMDLEKKPVIYDIKDKTGGKGTKDVEYHSILPLVVMAKEDGVMVFDRESGDEITGQRLKISSGALAGVIVNDAYFSPDGLNVILDCTKDERTFLYKAPLILSDAERAEIKMGLPAVAHEPAPAGPSKINL